jgi:hypothetical protein
MRPTYLASIPHRRRPPRAHGLRYAITYRVGIPAALLLARRGPVELAIRLAARWAHLAAIVWSHHDGRGWTDDVGDGLDDLATTVTLALRERLTTRIKVDRRDLTRLDRIAAIR